MPQCLCLFYLQKLFPNKFYPCTPSANGLAALPGNATGLHCASAKLWQGPIQLLTCSIVCPGSSVQSNWELRFQDKFLFVHFVGITDPDVWGHSCGNWWCSCVCICVCVYSTMCEQLFWITEHSVWTVLAMCSFLLQASVCVLAVLAHFVWTSERESTKREYWF